MQVLTRTRYTISSIPSQRILPISTSHIPTDALRTPLRVLTTRLQHDAHRRALRHKVIPDFRLVRAQQPLPLARRALPDADEPEVEAAHERARLDAHADVGSKLDGLLKEVKKSEGDRVAERGRITLQLLNDGGMQKLKKNGSM